MLSTVTEEDLAELYAWVDSVPLSRPKKSIARDFSDAVCIAEIVHHYFPRIIELHNYSPASNSTQKMNNWTTLNTRVFKKLGFTLPKEAMEGAVFARAGEIEPILKLLRTKLAEYQAKHGHERAAQIPIVAVDSPDGIHGIFSRGGEGHVAPRSFSRSQAGAGAAAGVNKVLDYQGNQDDVDSYNEAMYGGYIQSFHGGADAANIYKGGKQRPPAVSGLAVEVEDLKSLNQILEVKAAKLEQLLRLKDAKIAALTARLQGAGLISPPPPAPHHVGAGAEVGI